MDSTQHTNNRPLVNLTFLNITRDSVTMQPTLHQVSDILLILRVTISMHTVS
jgi:hypothetical protein